MNRLLQSLVFLFTISVTFSAWAQPTYCVPPTQCGSSADPAIWGVKFGTISTTSTCAGYTLFPETANNTTTVERSATYRATLQFRGTYRWFETTAEFQQLGFFYIDFNADGEFSAAEIYTVSGSQSRPGFIDIQIPAEAVLGKTRMRVRHRLRTGPEWEVIGPCEFGLYTADMAYETEDYTITIVESNPGIPACPTASTPAANATNITRNPDYTFTWAGATGGKNTTYDLLLGESPTALASVAADVISPDGNNGAFNYAEFLNQNTAHYYRVQPKNIHGINTGCPVRKFTTAVTSNRYYCTPSAACYYARNGSQSYYYYIKGVTLNTLATTSACTGTTGAYTLFPAGTTTTLTKGTSYVVTARTLAETIVSGGTSFPHYGGCNVGYISVWIDFNQNGDFTDPGEFFALSEQTSESTGLEPGACIGPTPAASITIPPHATSGTTRMRVRANMDEPFTATDACTNISRGETEDYTITIAPTASCTALKVAVAKTDDISTSTPNGSITLTPSGGIAPYTVAWSGGNTGSFTGLVATGLTKGVYYSAVTDANGCLFTNGPIYITKPLPLQITRVTTINPGCGEPGKIEVTVAGGIGPYTFQWNDPQRSGNFLDNLSEGTYQAVITDSRGATVTTPLLTLTALAYELADIKNATCATDYSGEITLAVSGGTTPYKYTWESNGYPIYMNSPTIPASGKTTYNVTITDARGCALIASPIYVDGPDTVKIQLHAVPANCNGMGNETGEISLSTGPSQGPFRYEIFAFSDWYTPLPMTSEEDADGFRFINVPPNDHYEPYFVQGYDINNCLSEHAAVSVSEVQPLDPTWGYQEICGQEPTLLTFLGYTPDMTLTWYADAETTQPLGTGGNLMAPTLTQSTKYYLLNEQYGCRSNVIPFEVNVFPLPPKPTISHSGGTVLCGGESLTLSVATGFQGYDWSDGHLTRTITVTEAGSYSVQVRNGFGCHSPASDPVVVTKITGSPRPEITVQGPLSFCEGENTLLSAPEGYTQYLWSDGVITRTRTVTQGGSYTVSAKTGATCISEPSLPVVISTLPVPAAPTITTSGSVSFCTGGSTQLSAPEGYTQYVWSDGTTTRTRTITQAGSYRVNVKNTTTCASAPSTPVEITILPKPAQPVITNSGSVSFCAGESTILSAPEGFTQYTWSDGGNTRTRTIIQAGSYSVFVKNAACVSEPSAAVVITLLSATAKPIITATGPTAFCPGESTTLAAPAGYAQYRWSDGVTTRERIVTQSGSYSVAVKSNGTCMSELSDVADVSLLDRPDKPVIRFTGPSAFCTGGGEVELLAPEGHEAYRWSTGATSSSIVVTEAGSYSVVVMGGCESPESDPAIVRQGEAPAPPQQLLLRSDNSLQALGGGMLYEWRLNGVVLSETDSRVPITQQGTYEVRSMTSEGCVSAELLTYVYLISAAEVQAITGLRVYPNPTTGLLNIQANTGGRTEIRLINTQGVVLRQLTADLAALSVLNLTDLPAGLYYVLIGKAGKSVTYKVTLHSGGKQ